MSAPVVFFGLLALKKAAATQWSAPVCPGGGSADFDHSPLRITVRSRNGSSGSKIVGYLKFLLPGCDFGSPGPPASGTHHPGAAPWGTKIPVKRVFGLAAVLTRGVCAGTIESSSGSANAAPAPRRTVRRDRCFLVTNIFSSLPYLWTARRSQDSLGLGTGRKLLLHLERVAFYHAENQG